MATKSEAEIGKPRSQALVDRLRRVRSESGHSQEYMADLLGLKGRQSYAAVERGDKGLTIDQVQLLAAGFPGQFDRFIGAGAYDSAGVRKYRQMILNIVQFGADARGSITKTKLAKLAYLADFTWYYEKLEAMSGLPYIRLEYGPVAQAYFQILNDLEEEEVIVRENSGQSILISLNEAIDQPRSLLEDGELQLIKKLARAWAKRPTAEIVEFTHQQLPWRICNNEEVIPYGLITQEESERIYGHLKKSR